MMKVFHVKNEKDDHILDSLSKIKHKKYELYIVSRILFILNDPEIEFVCQQYVKTSSQRNFMDLYFPQFKVYLKINEGYHNNKEQKEKDKYRDREILDAAKLTPKEINAFNVHNGKNLPLSAIDQKIEDFCKFIKKLKEKSIIRGAFNPWIVDDTRYDPTQYMKSETINVEDNVIVRYQHHALKIFGANYKGWQSGSWRHTDTHTVWFPKLYKVKKSLWDNQLSEDGSVIIERKLDGSSITHQESFNFKRVVFAHLKNNLGKTVYKFIGVFETSSNESSENRHVHNLVSTSYPVGS